MQLWKKPRKYSYVPLILAGAISAHGAHCLFKQKRSLRQWSHWRKCLAFDTHNCIVHTLDKKKVVIQGLDGYIVADDGNKLLICKLSEEQRIKQFSSDNK